jgi:WD40 repeat protein
MYKYRIALAVLLILTLVAPSIHAQDNVQASHFTMKPFAKQENMALGLTISPDGSMIIVGGGNMTANGTPFSDNGITIWDAATGDMLRHLPSTATFVADVVLTPDGKQVIGALDDTSVGIWDVETGELLRQVQKVNTTKLAISPDGQKVISSQRASHPILWDFQTGQIIHTFAESTVFYGPVAFSPNDKTIALVVGATDAADSPSSLIMWDTETNSEICRLDAISMAIPGSAFSPDGRFLALATSDKGILVVDGETCEIVHQFENMNALDSHLVDAAEAVSFSADGRQILSSWDPGYILLWDVETGASTYVGSDNSLVYHVIFTPEGIPISTSYSGAIDMWIPNG